MASGTKKSGAIQATLRSEGATWLLEIEGEAQPLRVQVESRNPSKWLNRKRLWQVQHQTGRPSLAWYAQKGKRIPRPQKRPATVSGGLPTLGKHSR